VVWSGNGAAEVIAVHMTFVKEHCLCAVYIYAGQNLQILRFRSTVSLIFGDHVLQFLALEILKKSRVHS